jgi:hypothetical protein
VDHQRGLAAEVGDRQGRGCDGAGEHVGERAVTKSQLPDLCSARWDDVFAFRQ